MVINNVKCKFNISYNLICTVVSTYKFKLKTRVVKIIIIV